MISVETRNYSSSIARLTLLTQTAKYFTALDTMGPNIRALLVGYIDMALLTVRRMWNTHFTFYVRRLNFTFLVVTHFSLSTLG